MSTVKKLADVVKLIDSTSNHNCASILVLSIHVVKLIDSTSNHNKYQS